MEYSPEILATASLIPLRDGFQISPPLWLHSTAPEWNAESGTSIDGRYHGASGRAHGRGVIKFQDTFKIGTAGRTGHPMTVVSGAWRDDWKTVLGDRFGLLMPDGAVGTTFEIKSFEQWGTIPCEIVILRRGLPAPGAPRTSNEFYAYLEIGAQATNIHYRIELALNRPIALQVQDAPFADWKTVAIARALGSLEEYLENNDHQVRFTIEPSYTSGVMHVEVGNGHHLRHSPERPASSTKQDPAAALPNAGGYRLHGKNGWIGFECHPLRYEPLRVKKSKINVGAGAIGAANAVVVGNLTGAQEPAQVSQATVQPDGQGAVQWEATATLPDAGDGLGSATPPHFADVVIYIPSIWGAAHAGTPIPDVRLGAMAAHVTEIWDDGNRIGRTFGTLFLNNSDGRYNFARGNYALDLALSNGHRAGQVLRGVMGFGPEGIQALFMDPVNILRVPFGDFFVKMERQLEQEVILDGLAFPTALRLLCDIGQVNPSQYLRFLPALSFPPYSDFFREYILPKGTALNPKVRFTSDATVVGCLVDLFQDAGLVLNQLTGASSVPYYQVFDIYGNYRVIAYNPGWLPPVKHYSATDPSGLGTMIDEPLVVSNSTESLCTHITVQGQDAYTFELLHYQEELPWNFGLVGWRRGALERNERYSSEQYVRQIARTLKIQASLNVQTVRFKAPYDPGVRAGDVVVCSHPRLGSGLFNVLRIDSIVGLSDVSGRRGHHDCYSWLTVRSIINSLVF